MKLCWLGNFINHIFKTYNNMQVEINSTNEGILNYGIIISDSLSSTLILTDNVYNCLVDLYKEHICSEQLWKDFNRFCDKVVELEDESDEKKFAAMNIGSSRIIVYNLDRRWL